jgi:hypothetical protein
MARNRNSLLEATFPSLCICGLLIIILIGIQPAQAQAPGITVSGNQLVTTSTGTLEGHVYGAGAPVVLRGVNLSGAEYACETSTVWDTPQGNQTTINEMMNSWHFNVVRVPLNEDCWLGINGEPSAPLTVAAYQSGIVTFANLANASGMIVEVDLHFGSGGKCVPKSDDYPGLDNDHASAFWQSVARTFKGNHSVIFNLINEPHSSSEIPWSCYLNGGCSVSGKGCSWTVVGTQSVVNTVRATGATNPIIIAGLNYSNDLSEWLNNVPTDSAKAIVAGAHVYFDGLGCEDSTCWTSEYGGIQAAGYPVVVDEFGDFKCSTEIDQLMDWGDARSPQVGYWAWSFNPFSCSKGPSLITDTAGDPTSPYGSDFQAHLISVQ